jgi:hypothetical protein
MARRPVAVSKMGDKVAVTLARVLAEIKAQAAAVAKMAVVVAAGKKKNE